jgi:hypothetical protein
MREYHVKLLRAHLNQDPQYTKPTSTKTVADISELKLNVKSVSIYKFPNEHSVVLEGSNLWFCHEVLLGEGEHKVSAERSTEMFTGRSIQFNYEPTDNTDHLVVDDKIKVRLHSHFSPKLMDVRIFVEQVSP